MGDTLGMAHRVGNRCRTSLGNTEQREAFEPGSVHDGFEIGHERLERNIPDFAV